MCTIYHGAVEIINNHYMTQEKWENTVGKIKDAFPVLEEVKEEAPQEGMDLRHFIVFQGPMGKTKLECLVRPKVIGQKVIASKRIGSGSIMEYLYSPEEKVYYVRAYQWDTISGNWMEMREENKISGF